MSERPDVGAALDWLEIEFGDPVAQEVVGEIFPVEVQPGERTEFAYYIRPQQVAGRGFDHLEVESSAPIEFVEVLVEGEVVEATAEPTEGGVAIALAAPVRSRQLVELRFVGTVFVDATRFDAFIAQGPADALLRQRVDAGDAYSEVVSSTNAVRLPVGARLLANVAMGPLALTPNGDGGQRCVAGGIRLGQCVGGAVNRPADFRPCGAAGVGAGRGGRGWGAGLGLGWSGELGCASRAGAVRGGIAG